MKLTKLLISILTIFYNLTLDGQNINSQIDSVVKIDTIFDPVDLDPIEITIKNKLLHLPRKITKGKTGYSYVKIEFNKNKKIENIEILKFYLPGYFKGNFNTSAYSKSKYPRKIKSLLPYFNKFIFDEKNYNLKILDSTYNKGFGFTFKAIIK